MRRVEKVLVVRLMQNMATALLANGLAITALGFDELASGVGLKAIPGKLSIIPRDFVDVTTPGEMFRSVVGICKCVRDHHPDVVHLNAIQDLVWAYVAVRIAVPRERRPAIIVMTHNPLTWANPTRTGLAVRLIRQLADGCIVLATARKSELLRFGIPADMLTVIPNALDPGIGNANIAASPEPPSPDRPFRLLYVANLCERKAQDVLVRAASIVLHRFPDIHLDLVGRVIPGEEEYARNTFEIAKNLGVATQVHYLGEVPHRDIMPLLGKCDIFVFPSRSEMMPRAVIEAMVAGRPVIASAVDGVLDLIENGKTGFLVPPGSPEDLAQAIVYVVEHPSEADEVARAGQQFVMDYCSPRRVGALFKEFYQSVLDGAEQPERAARQTG